MANGCVCYHPWCTDSGFRLGGESGGKVTCRNSMRPAVCSELACCVRRPPRVVIAVPTRGSALSSSHYRGSTSSSSRYRGANRGFSRLGQSAQPTLLSLSWYKPWFDVLLESLSWYKPGVRHRIDRSNGKSDRSDLVDTTVPISPTTTDIVTRSSRS